MKHTDIPQEFIDFLKQATTPFHAVAWMIKQLEQAGFSKLSEKEPWQVRKGGRYYVTRNDSALVAFTMGNQAISDTGIHMAGAHTDSPCLKIKPLPEIFKKTYVQLGVEVYGSALLNTWFDRDLSIAGRISWRDTQGTLKKSLIDFKNPIAILPSLAIHFDRQANEHKSVNAQTDLPPIIIGHWANSPLDFQDVLKAQIKQETGAANEPEAITAHDLYFYDTHPPSFTGLNREFISGGRLDNLLSCYVGLTGIMNSAPPRTNLLVLNDHEEIGSNTAAGAQGPFLTSILNRLCPEPEHFGRAMARSIMISMDNAHGVHPNHMEKYDPNHSPVINNGPAIKINAAHRYASDSDTISMFKQICQDANVPFQEFVMRSDMPCGSTIGPITAAKLGVKTIDIGVPTFAMHSIREIAGTKDVEHLFKAICAYFSLTEAPFPEAI